MDQSRKQLTQVRKNIIWFSLWINELIYLLVLVLLAWTEVSQDQGSFSFEQILQWKGFVGLEAAHFQYAAIGSGVLCLLWTLFMVMFADGLMQRSHDETSFLRNMIIGCVMASVPGVFGLVLTLLNGKILIGLVFFALSLLAKLKFYPGLHTISNPSPN